MADETIKIYVWPDGSWISEEDIDDMEWYLFTTGKSDDYKEYQVPIELEAEDIEELISLNALPGMLPDPTTIKIEDMGKIEIPEDALLIVHHSKDIDYNAVTILKDRMIVNAPGIFIEVITSKDKNE